MDSSLNCRPSLSMAQTEVVIESVACSYFSPHKVLIFHQYARILKSLGLFSPKKICTNNIFKSLAFKKKDADWEYGQHWHQIWHDNEQSDISYLESGYFVKVARLLVYICPPTSRWTGALDLVSWAGRGIPCEANGETGERVRDRRDMLPSSWSQKKKKKSFSTDRQNFVMWSQI